MKLLEFFKENNFNSVSEGVEKLKELYGIKVKEYPKDNLYVFNYCQIESPKTNDIVMECRGLILRDNFEIVCRPFDRFFNLGEALNITEKFSVSNSIVYEKLDGSLCKVYHSGESWQVATRGTAYAESENYTGEIFQDLMLNAFGFQNLWNFSNALDLLLIPQDWTLIFEYTSPNNRIVTPYTEDKMYLLGVRDNFSGRDLFSTVEPIYHALKNSLNVSLPKTFEFSNPEDMKEFVNSLDGLQEGVVAFDLKNNLRVKVKADQYVAVHRLRGDSIPTPKRILGLVVTNETEEYLAYFPEERERFAPYMESFVKLQYRIQEIWDMSKNIEDQKEFALFVKDYMFSFILFQARKNSEDPIHVLNTQEASRKVKLMDMWLK